MLGSPRGGGGGGDASEGRSARPAATKAKAGATAGAASDDFEEFPGALQDEDDDLPF
jgi:single-strand DNA-binding protein